MERETENFSTSAGKSVKPEKVIKLLNRLKTAHHFYAEAFNNRSEFEMVRILEAMETTIGEVGEALAVNRSFAVLWILYGDDFTKYEFGVTMVEYIARIC